MRAEMMGRPAEHLASQYVGHPLRVGVDGRCGRTRPPSPSTWTPAERATIVVVHDDRAHPRILRGLP